ncbi:Flp pilus assembly complex ATPase component TadA [Candidatus Saccharibacteria bacterium]|nr:Flp pilus assembly complex ATPase component TadA [Candidatus Saccharibacteria bacterium]
MLGGKIAKLLKGSVSSATLDDLLDLLAKNNLYDIHIEPMGETYHLRTRLNGKLQPLDKISHKAAENLIQQLKIRCQLPRTATNIPQEATFLHGNLLVQFFNLPTLDGEKAYLRIINQKSISKNLAKLGLYGQGLKECEAVNKLPSGLVIVLGEGKTTTMFSLLSRFDSNKLNLSTVERQASYNLPNVNQFVAGDDYHSLAYDALKAAINQRSDVILVEDIGSPELAKLAVDSAQRGRLIITSLPVNDSFAVYYFLVSMGLKPFLVASSLRLIINQKIMHTGLTTQLEARPISTAESNQILKDYHIKATDLHELEKQAKTAGLGENLSLSTSSSAINKLFTLNTEKLTKIMGLFEVVPINEIFRNMLLAGVNERELKEHFIAHGGVDLELDYLIKALRKIVPFIKIE